MFEGYLGRPAETLTQLSNLWFHTGDLGRFDEDGLLYFVDRKKDAIRRRGENISSFEVEQAVLAHPAVLECAAHAVPSPLGEDDVKVCVVIRPGHDLDPSQVWLLSRDRLPAFAVPQYIELLDELPKNQVGRVQKHLLRERGVTPTTWAAPAGDRSVRNR
jgi:crotonobetaine/carnitine-CoA ligase